MAKRSDPIPAILRTHSDSHRDEKEQVSSSEPAFDAAQWELENVHDVYASIASHFSATRYKPWPLVSDFFASLPSGSLGIDVGCGNGKYLHLRNLLHEKIAESSSSRGDCITIGVDRSAELIDIARDQSIRKMTQNQAANRVKADDKRGTIEGGGGQFINEVAVGDALGTGFRSMAFDYAISIATIHHFSTQQRRMQSIQELVRLIRPVGLEKGQGEGGRGRFLVYVWALEQKGQERRKFDDEDRQRRQDAADDGQVSSLNSVEGRDVLVPWVLKVDRSKSNASQRPEAANGNRGAEQVYQRYYHLFQASELEGLVDEAVATLSYSGNPTAADGRSIRVVKESSGWERGNWWGIWKVHWSKGV